MRRRLPLLKVQRHDMAISERRSHSGTLVTKDALAILPSTHLEQILRNPEIWAQLYFGPGVEAEERSELWHGEFWKESPLLGDHELSTCEGNVSGWFVEYMGFM
jgi:hypothetical protein